MSFPRNTPVAVASTGPSATFAMPGVDNWGHLGGLLDALVEGFLFGPLNLLSWLTGIYGGVQLAPINVPGMLFALTNRDLLNQHWTFKTPASPGRRVGRFVLVSLLGVGLNTALVVALTHFVPRPTGLPPLL